MADVGQREEKERNRSAVLVEPVVTSRGLCVWDEYRVRSTQRTNKAKRKRVRVRVRVMKERNYERKRG